MAQESTVLPQSDKERVAVALEEDAEVMSNTQLIELLENEPPQIQAEVIRINTDARPLALRWLCWFRSLPACWACSIRSG
jgi:hypothetical protein